MNSRKRHETATLTNPLFAQTLRVLGRHSKSVSESDKEFRSNGIELPRTASWDTQPQIRILLPCRSGDRSASHP